MVKKRVKLWKGFLVIGSSSFVNVLLFTGCSNWVLLVYLELIRFKVMDIY